MSEQRPTDETERADGPHRGRDDEVERSTATGGARPDDEAPGNFVDDPDGDIPEPNEPA